jgi:hypothetical protein
MSTPTDPEPRSPGGAGTPSAPAGPAARKIVYADILDYLTAIKDRAAVNISFSPHKIWWDKLKYDDFRDGASAASTCRS